MAVRVGRDGEETGAAQAAPATLTALLPEYGDHASVLRLTRTDVLRMTRVHSDSHLSGALLKEQQGSLTYA